MATKANLLLTMLTTPEVGAAATRLESPAKCASPKDTAEPSSLMATKANLLLTMLHYP